MLPAIFDRTSATGSPFSVGSDDKSYSSSRVQSPSRPFKFEEATESPIKPGQAFPSQWDSSSSTIRAPSALCHTSSAFPDVSSLPPKGPLWSRASEASPPSSYRSHINGTTMASASISSLPLMSGAMPTLSHGASGGEPLRILRSVRTGQSSSNTNPKLARLAAMMDEYKFRDVDVRPSSRAASMTPHLMSGSPLCSSTPRTSRKTPRLPDEAKAEVESTMSSARGTQRHDKPTDRSPKDRSPSPTSPLEKRVRALQKEEDYWRGYRELEESQRRYYIWTFLRRGELPDRCVDMFSVAHAVRPSSASLQPAERTEVLPVRPASGGWKTSLPPRSNTQSVTEKALTPAASVLVPATLLSPTVATAPCHRSTDDAGTVYAPLASAVHFSPIRAVAMLHELSLQLQEDCDDLHDSEFVERARIEDREQTALASLFGIFQARSVPVREDYERQRIVRLQQEMFYATTSSVSRYMRMAEDVEMDCLFAKQRWFDASVATSQRQREQRLFVLSQEHNLRTVVYRIEADVFKLLLRRWHKHFQVMLLRSRTYESAISVVFAICTIHVSEQHTRWLLEVDEMRQRSLARRWLPTAKLRVEDAITEEQIRVECFTDAVRSVMKWRKQIDAIRQDILLCEHEEARVRSLICYQEGRDWHVLDDFNGDSYMAWLRVRDQLGLLNAIVSDHEEAARDHFEVQHRLSAQIIESHAVAFNPEAAGRCRIVEEYAAVVRVMNAVNQFVLNACGLQRYTEMAMHVELHSVKAFLEEVGRLESEEHVLREKICDLEDEAYEDDFIISHQRMRRLDTVRSFIIASPAQERRSRLALEAEYREGLYMLMEMNDDVMTITRTAEAAMSTKEHIFQAFASEIERDVRVVQPERRDRFALEVSFAAHLNRLSRALSFWVATIALQQQLLSDHKELCAVVFTACAETIRGLKGIDEDEWLRRNEIDAANDTCRQELRNKEHLMTLEAQESEWRRVNLSQVEATTRCVVTSAASSLFQTTMLYAEHIRHHEVVFESADVSSCESQQRAVNCWIECACRTFVYQALDLVLSCTCLKDSAVADMAQFFNESALCVTRRGEIFRVIHGPELFKRAGLSSKEELLRVVVWRAAAVLRGHIAAYHEAVADAEAQMSVCSQPIRLILLSSVTESETRNGILSQDAAIRASMAELLQVSWEWLLCCDALHTCAAAGKAKLFEDCVAELNTRLQALQVQLPAVEAQRRLDCHKAEDDQRGVLAAWHRYATSIERLRAELRSAKSAVGESLRGLLRSERNLRDEEVITRHAISDEFAFSLRWLLEMGSKLMRLASGQESSFYSAAGSLYSAAAASVAALCHALEAHPLELRRKALFLLEDDASVASTLDFSWYDGAHRCTDDTLQLVHTLTAHNSSWRELLLSHTQFSRRHDDDAAGNRLTLQSISLLSTWTTRLTRLELRNCGLSDDDLHPSLTQHLAEPACTIEVLALDENDFSSQFCKEMFATLRVSDTLTQVSLSGNPKIAKGLLQVLHFYGSVNKVGHPLKAAILDIEANDPSRTSWRCVNADLTDDAVKLVCVALFQNTSITHVDFSGHRNVTDASCVSIASMLRGNASVGSLDMAGTSITDVGLHQIEHVVKSQAYRQPLLYANLFSAPPTQLLQRRRSSRALRQLEPQQHMSEQGGFMLSMHHARVSDEKYLQCVLAMNSMERAWVEIDEDETSELLVAAFLHLREQVEEFDEQIREVEDVFDAVEAHQNRYFIDKVFLVAEGRTRAKLVAYAEARRSVIATAHELLSSHMELRDATCQRQEHLYAIAVQVATTAWRIQSWTPSPLQLAAIAERVEIPELHARQGIENLYADITIRTVERYHKYAHGVEKYKEKCLQAKQTLYEKHTALYRMSVGVETAHSGVMMSEETAPVFVPDELDPKQHQALAHLATQPWELQGKGLGIAQNDPHVVVLDISYAGVANPEEPSCTQDTIAILYTLAKNNTHLKEVNLAGSKAALTAKCAPLLAKLAVKLTVLNLSDCAIDEERALPHLLGAVAQPHCTLQTLVLDGNSISPQAATQLCRAMRANTSIQRLSVNRLPAPMPKVTADFLSFYTDVNKLAKPYRSLIRRLEANDTTCTTADFTYGPGLRNSLGQRLVSDVSSVVGCGSDDGSAVSPETPLDDVGVKLLCIALSRNMILEALLLPGNTVTDRGVKFLSHILLSSPSIRTVDLSCNSFTDTGAQLLLSVAEKNTRLQDIRITANNGSVTPQTRRLLQAQLQHNKTM